MKLSLAERQASGLSTPRTLNTLDNDNQSFMSAGGNLQDAKDYNNVIDKYFFDIPLENVNFTDIDNVIIYIVLTGVHSWFAPISGNIQPALVLTGWCSDGT